MEEVKGSESLEEQLAIWNHPWQFGLMEDGQALCRHIYDFLDDSIHG